MKISPVSADLLIKLGLGVAVIAAIYWAADKVSGAASDTWDSAATSVKDGFHAVSPMNNQNIIYQTANTWTGGSNDAGTPTLGTRIYDWLHPGQ